MSKIANFRRRAVTQHAREAKVAQFDDTGGRQEYVFWFDVAVNAPMMMAVTHSLKRLPDNLLSQQMGTSPRISF
jgi:hypothetical protein